MDKETQIIIVEACAVAIIMHSCIRRYGIACVITVISTPILYAVESFFRLKLPPAKLEWLPMILPFLMFYSLLPALVVGLPFVIGRKFVGRKASG